MDKDTSYAAIMDSPLGKLGLIFVQDKLAQINFLPPSSLLINPTSSFAQHAVEELNKYFISPRHTFNIPTYHEQNNTFAYRVWHALLTIPCGQTLTYSDLAKKLGTHARPIGNACRRNPLPIIFPCHRVIAKHGYGGYSGSKTGSLMEIKLWLLNHEKYGIAN